MSIISITIPNNKLQKATDALCAWGNYQATLEDGTPNPETPSVFAKRVVAEFIQHAMQKKQRDDLLKTANQTALDDVSDIQ